MDSKKSFPSNVSVKYYEEHCGFLCHFFESKNSNSLTYWNFTSSLVSFLTGWASVFCCCCITSFNLLVTYLEPFLIQMKSSCTVQLMLTTQFFSPMNLFQTHRGRGLSGKSLCNKVCQFACHSVIFSWHCFFYLG